MSLALQTPHELALQIAGQLKAQRLAQNLSQTSLSKRSGVPLGTLKRFEHRGQIGLLPLLKLALALGRLDDFEALFRDRETALPRSLDELLEKKSRKRGQR